MSGVVDEAFDIGVCLDALSILSPTTKPMISSILDSRFDLYSMTSVSRPAKKCRCTSKQASQSVGDTKC